MKKTKDITSGMHLLRRWISGEADAQDERALRAEAGDDPFLQDALEGLEAFPEGAHAGRITRIKGRLRQRASRRVALPVFILRRAAAVLVIGLAGYGAWIMLRDTPVAMQEKSIAMQDTASAPSAEELEVAEQLPPSETAGTKTVPSRQEAASRSQKKTYAPVTPAIPEASDVVSSSPPAETAEAPAGLAVVPPPIAVETTSQGKAAMTTQEAITATEERKPAPAPSAPAPAAATPSGRTLSGRVTGPDGEPLIGASVVVQGTTRGAVTDFDGNYQLSVPADAGNVRLIVSYTGYMQKAVDAGAGSRLNIILNESEATMSEVVVTGYGKRKSARASRVDADPWPVMPRGGFAALETHISQNLRMPGVAPGDNSAREVELEFSVSTQGKLYNFRVLRTPGPAFSDEAIRLLRSGPRWENRSGDVQKAKYTIVF